jgi:hypothetical protein
LFSPALRRTSAPPVSRSWLYAAICSVVPIKCVHRSSTTKRSVRPRVYSTHRRCTGAIKIQTWHKCSSSQYLSHKTRTRVDSRSRRHDGNGTT